MDQAPTVATRLRALLAHAPELRLDELDALAGLASGHVSQILRGRTAMPRPGTLAALGRVFNVTEVWLAYGVGEAPCAAAVSDAVAGAVKRARRKRHVSDLTDRAAPRKLTRRSGSARTTSVTR